MKIIVGLGNPKDSNKDYSNTRHNAGFIFIDKLEEYLTAQNIKLNWKTESKFQAITCKVQYKNQDLLLVKPLTYMNLSGESIQKILSFYKESPENLIVIYDDIDLALGTFRYREKGSAGTHNGMRSIIQSLGSQDFHRIRLGIESRGELSPEKQELHSFVLSSFTAKESTILDKTIKESLKKLEELIKT